MRWSVIGFSLSQLKIKEPDLQVVTEERHFRDTPYKAREETVSFEKT